MIILHLTSNQGNNFKDTYGSTRLICEYSFKKWHLNSKDTYGSTELLCIEFGS